MAKQNDKSISEDQVDLAKEHLDILKNITKLESGIRDLEKESVEYAKVAEGFRKMGYEHEAKEAELTAKSAKFQKQITEKALKEQKAREKAAKAGKDYKKILKKRLEQEEKYKNLIKGSLGFIDDIVKTVEEIPLIGGLLSKSLEGLQDKVADSIVKPFYEANESGSKFKNILGGVQKAIPLIGAALAIGLLAYMVEIQKETVKLSRTLSITLDQAKEYREQMAETARNSENALMTVANQTKAMGELAKEFNSTLSLSKDLVESQVFLSDNLGVSVESASKLNRLFTLTNKPAKQVTAEMINIVNGFNDATNAGFMINDVMEDVANVSSSVRANFHGNIKELTVQVLKAKQLGTTLDAIAKLGRSSLNIEESVTK
jgi:hypothetical protein